MVLYLQYSIAYKSEYRRHVGTIKLRGLSLVNSGLSLVKGGLSLTTPLQNHPRGKLHVTSPENGPNGPNGSGMSNMAV
jgi:hypothetical protein